nr:hypothetical protein [Tanacetum cinerariifolium]
SDSEHESDENESGSESDHQDNKEKVEDDEEEKEDEYVITPSYYYPTDDEDKTNVDDNAKGDKDEEMDYTTRNENLETTHDQVIEDAHVTINIVAKKNEVPVTSSSYLSDLAAKFLNFADIPITEAEIISPMDVLVHHESSYEEAASLTEFELKKILIDKIDKSESYLAALEHRECYDRSIKSYDLNKSLFSTYDKVYSFKRSQKDKDKDEDPSTGSDRWLKKSKTSKDAKPKKGLKAKESQSGSSKDIPQDQEENLGNDDEEPKGKTPQQRPTQSWLMTLAANADKPTKTFDDLKGTLVYFFAFVMNDIKINNLAQEILLGPAFKLLKGTRTNYAELEYDFEECYKALSKKIY